MNRQIVQLTSDSGEYIAPMYAVIQATVGSTAATTYLWLECIGYGISTKNELDALKAVKVAGTKPDFSVLHGTKGAYSVVALSTVAEYSSPESFIYGEKNIGTLP